MHRRSLAAAVVLAVAVSGCLGLLAGDGDVDPATVSERVDGRLASLDALNATVVRTMSGERNSSYRVRLSYERPDRVRMTILNGSAAGTRIVSNGTTTWRYDTGDDVVRVIDRPYVEGIGELLPGATALRSNATFEGNETLAGDDAVELSYALQGEEVSLFLAGGQPTSRFSQQAVSGEAGVRVWLDTERWLPRKTRISLPMFRRNRSITLRYERLTVDPELPGDTFQFDPPAGARWERGDASPFRPPDNATRFQSRSAAGRDASVPVPDPSMPEGYTFTVARVFDAHHLAGVELTYENASERLEVVVLEERPPLFDRGRTVRIDGREGLVVDHPVARLVQWECPETLRIVSGPADADPDRLQSVAASIGCS